MASAENETDINNKMLKTKVSLDAILIEDIGQFGMYQFRILLLTILFVIMTGFSAMEYLFSTARINTRCLIPECESLETAEFSPSWVLNAVPASEHSVENCYRYSSRNSTTRSGECSAEWFNREDIVGCSEYVYENTDTVVYDFGLACDEWRRIVIGSVQTFGGILAMPITGFISDRWGRRVAFGLNAVNTAWLGVVRCWSNNYYIFLMFEFLKATLGGGGYSCVYILVMELVGPKYRVAAGATISTSYPIGLIILACIAWAIPYWKSLLLTLYLPYLIFISYFWIMSESVRWYMSKGRYQEAMDFLKNVARVNKRELSDKTLEALKESIEAEKVQNTSDKVTRAQEPWLIVLVFQHKAILKRCCVTPIWWIASSLIYYGMSINAVNMSGNRYVNFMAVAAIEIPGFWLAVLLMNRIGRKPVLISAYWTCAACQLAYIFIPANYYAVSLSIYLIGKLSIAIVMMSLYIYTSELYPTRYRHSLLAFSSMIGRVGTVIAPLTPAFSQTVWLHFPAALFCGCAMAAGALVFLAPETLGTKLPDTMEEASVIGIKRHRK